MNKFVKSILFPISKILPDKVYLSLAYRHFFHSKINWNDPKTFNEKIQWLKVYDHNPQYITMVDKYEAKKYISKKIGAKYVIPTYGVWDSFKDIPFEKLPEKFVLKCTHDSGSVFIIRNKDDFEWSKLETNISSALKRNFYWFGREWAYKNVKPRIIAEKLLESDDILDYKVFAFNGEAKALFVASDRNTPGTETKFNFFDASFHPLDIINGHPISDKTIERPHCFGEMIGIAEKLSEGMPQVRIDFYEVDNRLFVGEITLYHWSGFKRFIPEKWDGIFGRWIDLSCVGCNYEKNIE